MTTAGGPAADRIAPAGRAIASATGSWTVTEMDFVLPEIWEGPSDEIHLNDRAAASRGPYGARVLSGVTSMILGSLPLIQTAGWAWPSSVRWEFLHPVVLGDRLVATWSAGATNPATRSFRAQLRNDRDNVVSQGSVEFKAPLPEERASSAPTGSTAGRTVFEADTSVFLWWLSQHGFRPSGTPDGTVPWPLFISLGAGLYWRTVGPSDDPPLVNRAMEWSLRRALRPGETINGIVWPADYRASRSREDWVVRQGRCSFHVDSDDGGEHELASYSATSMFQRV